MGLNLQARIADRWDRFVKDRYLPLVCFGPRGAARYRELLSVVRRGRDQYQSLDKTLVQLSPHAAIRRPVWVRRATTDILVLREIVIVNVYGGLHKLSDRISYAIDAGANVGYAAAAILSHSPDARILLVEPDAGNAAVALLNLKQEIRSGQCTVIEGAVWSEDTHLVLKKQGREWSFYVRERSGAEEADVAAFSIGTLIEKACFPHVDLLKIDAEGAEATIFRSDVSSWIDKIRVMAVELHRDFDLHEFRRFATQHGFRIEPMGEITWAYRDAT